MFSRLLRRKRRDRAGTSHSDLIAESFTRKARKYTRFIGKADYIGPENMLATLRTVTSTRFPSVLDLGCGTGLFGEYIRQHCDELHGIDLSAGMIDEARKTGVYTELFVADVSTFCRASQQTYDLVAACGCFQFAPDLAATLTDVAGVLAEDGLLLFSVDDAEESGVSPRSPIMTLHSHKDVQAACAASGLQIQHETVIRDRNHRPTAAAIYCRYVVAGRVP